MNAKIISMITLIASAAFLLAGIGISLHVITFDHYGGAYGVSIGTTTHYCSAETVRPIFTCEAAS